MSENNKYRKALSGLQWRNIALVAVILLVLVFPNILYLYTAHQPLSLMIKYVVISVLFLLTPLFLFYRNIKIYLYLLLPFVLFVPFVCFSISLFGLKFGSKLAGLILQTNLNESLELTRGYLLPFLLIAAALIAGYIFLVRKISFRRISFKVALVISLLSGAIVWGKMFQLMREFKITSMYGLLDEYYPVSVISSFSQALFTSRNNLDKAKDFSFHAYRKDTLGAKQVYVFIIGESSRYDHWQINGYARPTSPRLAAREHLVTFPDVASGAHFTWLSVPQMITRANADNINLQYREKSVLSAFDEAGFKTAWLSNQEPDYYTGSFTLHAETADVFLSNDAEEMRDNRSPYDEKYLPVLDSVIRHTPGNLFIVLHTMGSHWDYSERYPAAFDRFKPSGKEVSINPPKAADKEAIINSYDNSILYTDYIIDSVINAVRKYDLVAGVMYISDHGEDLFEQDKSRLDFHLTASVNTLHVPLFLWTSEKYDSIYRDKKAALMVNRNKKIGEENIFYTLLGMADISFPQYDSTKNILSEAFRESAQKYVEDGTGPALLYQQLRK